MADEGKKTAKPVLLDEKAAKEAANATLLALAKTDAQKAATVKAPASVAVKTPAVVTVKTGYTAAVKVDEKPVMVAQKVEAEKAPVTKPDVPKTEAENAESGKAAVPEVKTKAPKAESMKEADPSKEFVDGIMTEMTLKGASKKRLIKMLAEQFNFDKQKVMFRLKRALITERYAAAHA
jgi:co-chaperonin GroES (HSP10)